MGDGLAVLGERRIVEVSGPDARAFLQRLITNDVEALGPGQARYAALLTPQGKIVADFFVVADEVDGHRFLLDVSDLLAADLVRTLSLYRLRAKVVIADRGDTLGALALPPASPGPADSLIYDDPRGQDLWRRGIAPRSTLERGGDPAASLACRDARIRAGVPEGGLDFTYGETFPHEANLDRLHGIDFRKGCYVGQEVVSRVEHRGTARKRVVGVAFEGEPPPVGTDLTVAGLPVGRMGSAVAGLGLALVRLDRVKDARQTGTPVLAGVTRLRFDGSVLV